MLRRLLIAMCSAAGGHAVCPAARIAEAPRPRKSGDGWASMREELLKGTFINSHKDGLGGLRGEDGLVGVLGERHGF